MYQMYDMCVCVRMMCVCVCVRVMCVCVCVRACDVCVCVCLNILYTIFFVLMYDIHIYMSVFVYI